MYWEEHPELPMENTNRRSFDAEADARKYVADLKKKKWPVALYKHTYVDKLEELNI